jgi:hypothetical protein
LGANFQQNRPFLWELRLSETSVSISWLSGGHLNIHRQGAFRDE